MRMKWTRVLLSGLGMLLFMVVSFSAVAEVKVKGIYIRQSTLLNAQKIQHLIDRSKAVGINAFVIDYHRSSERYRKAIELVKANGFRYVARIVMFPHGGTTEQVNSPEYLEKRYEQIKSAVAMGADEIQLDYIRFRSSHHPSPENAKKINEIIHSVKKLLEGSGVALQADLFGIVAHRPSLRIGQDAALFAENLDAICPMVYPSHYEPYERHAKNPYATIYNAMTALRHQVRENPNVQLYAYIELFNYRYPLTKNGQINYINGELDAVRDSRSDGWYAWSARNKYDALFTVLEGRLLEEGQSGSNG